MRPLLLLLLVGVAACSGRTEPSSDGGPAGDGGVVDAGASDGGSADAGNVDCVDPADPCAEGKAPSDDRPCMPWEATCDHVHTCDADEARWCRVVEMCLAMPSCEPGTSGSELPCGLDEPDCRTLSVCGSTLHCRVDMDCDAAPSCPPNQLQSRVPCGLDEPECHSIYMCGQALWCREDTGCDGIPSCERGIATEYPCVEGEEHCERSSACGATVFCRY